MADMEEALRKAGVRVSNPGARSPQGGASGDLFPLGYPQYFTPEGHTRVELLKEEAWRIAKKFDDEHLTRHQLRAFYDQAKKQLQRLHYGMAFGEVHPEIARLKAFAADRAARANSIPRSFKEFIDRNVDAVTDRKSFEKGFMPHFEAVVAYCARARD